MSLLDQVRKLEQQVTDRLKELEPLTREYEQLRKFAERFGLKYSPGSADAEPASERAPTAGGGGTRASAKERSARTPAKAARATRSAGRTRAAKTQARPRAARASSAQRAAGSARAASASAPVAPARRRKAAGSGGHRAGGQRVTATRRGQRHDDVLRLVAEYPGITVRELGERLGVDATGLYRVVKRLSDDGRVRKQGTGLHPVVSATASPPAPQATLDGAPQTPAGDVAEAPEAPVPAASGVG